MNNISEDEMDKITESVFVKYDKDKNYGLDPKEVSNLLSDAYKKIGK